MPGIFDNLVNINNDDDKEQTTQPDGGVGTQVEKEQTDEKRVTAETFYGKDFNDYYKVENS